MIASTALRFASRFIQKFNLHHRTRKRRFVLILFGSVLSIVYFGSLIFSQRNEQKHSADILDLTSIKKQADQKCIHPSLSLWTPELRVLYSTKPPPLHCSTVEKDWVYTHRGTFQISQKALNDHGSIHCEYSPILRGKDDFNIEINKTVTGDNAEIKTGDKLITDFFKVNCRGSDGRSYKNTHAGIAISQSALSRSQSHEARRSSSGLDILMFGFDSVSRMTWMRTLPKSHDYFVNRLGGVVLEGYNIVGDGTTQALLPILSGKTENELPESRRGFEGAETVDKFPWIWKDLHERGYVTQFGEDQSMYGTFTYRLLGFQNQPVDHYMRTFHIAVEEDKRHPYCLSGSTPEYLAMMNWMREFVDVYKSQPKFSFVFDAELTHDSSQSLPLADNDLLDLLVHLNDSGHLDNALLVLMSDHGARFTDLRETEQGRLEERNPYMGIRLPPKFIARHPEAHENLRNNVHRLTTPFDLHYTLRDVIDFRDARKEEEARDGAGPDEGGRGDMRQRGISLLKEIPKDRSCSDAGIDLHWCACLSWSPQSIEDHLVKLAAQEIVQKFNNLMAGENDKCEKLSILEVKSAVKYSANDDILKFRKSLDLHGRQPDLSDDRRASIVLYLISVITTPGRGLFEATVTYRAHTNNFTVNSESVSRLNKYGKQPHCVMDRLPHLRQFCYCKVQL